MSFPIAFIICTEPGRLEHQSLLLAKSIRQFGGKLKDTPIYSFHPRPGNPIAASTLARFETLNVYHQQIPLNTEFPDYYLANKPLACAYAEQTIDAHILVFIDSDQCILREPSEFFLPVGCNVGLRPEYGKGIGSSGIRDRQDDYWRSVYDLVGVQEERFVITPIGHKRIRAYWNTGMIAVRCEAGIFTAWKNNFETVMRLNICPLQGDYMVEQSMFGVTVCALKEPVHTFSSSYSYPLPLHNRISKASKLSNFDQLVSMHYFSLFYFDDWKSRLQQLRDFDCHSPKYEWLCEQIAQLSLPKRSWNYTYRMLKKQLKSKLNLMFCTAVVH
jgi:hypothetical protein